MNMMEVFTGITSLATLGMLGGVFFAACQLKLSKRQMVTDFEDVLDREFREIAAELPVEAFLSEKLNFLLLH